MLTPDKKESYRARLNARIDVAVQAVFAAEAELASALGGLVPVPVGDNQLITPGLEMSLAKVRTARAYVGQLQQLRARV